MALVHLDVLCNIPLRECSTKNPFVLQRLNICFFFFPILHVVVKSRGKKLCFIRKLRCYFWVEKGDWGIFDVNAMHGLFLEQNKTKQKLKTGRLNQTGQSVHTCLSSVATAALFLSHSVLFHVLKSLVIFNRKTNWSAWGGKPFSEAFPTPEADCNIPSLVPDQQNELLCCGDCRDRAHTGGLGQWAPTEHRQAPRYPTAALTVISPHLDSPFSCEGTDRLHLEICSWLLKDRS